MVGVESAGVPRIRTLGRYELFAKLGSGGMAEVHLARQRGLKRFRKLVVVKTVHPQLSRDERFVDLLLDEARISALLKHPRVVDVYDVDEDNGVVFIAMEYLPGQSVTEIIRAGRRRRKIDVLSAAQIICDAAEGLDAAHNLRTHGGEDLELVHRDVSPGNIVVLYTGEVKLVDFGVAKARDHLSSSAIGKFAGKLGYAAPEQLENENADRRSDIFSLGVVFWELLCHRRLFSAKTRSEALELVSSGRAPKPSSIREESPAAFDDICLRALRPAREDRFQTAKDFLDEIRVVLSAEGYSRDDNLITDYMTEVFAEERAETEELVRRVSETTNEVSLAELANEDAATAFDEALPGRIALLEEGETSPPITPTGTSPGRRAEPITDRVSEIFRTGEWRRPVLYGLIAVATILLIFFTVALGTSGTSASDSAASLEALTPENGSNEAPAADSVGALDAAAAQSSPAAADGSPQPAPSHIVDPPPSPNAGQSDKPSLETDSPEKRGQDGKAPAAAKDPNKDEDKDKPKPRDRETAQARYEEGVRAIRTGDLGSARSKLDAALAADSSYAPAHRGLGVVFQASGDAASAVRAYRRYLKLRPKAKDAERIKKTIEELGG